MCVHVCVHKCMRNSVCACVCVGECAIVYVWQRTTYRNEFSPSTMWVLEMELSSSCLPPPFFSQNVNGSHCTQVASYFTPCLRNPATSLHSSSFHSLVCSIIVTHLCFSLRCCRALGSFPGCDLCDLGYCGCPLICLL